MNTYYWVGNSGSADDDSHWSLTSGGSGGAGIPVDGDTIIIDYNSITISGQTITFPVALSIANFYIKPTPSGGSIPNFNIIVSDTLAITRDFSTVIIDTFGAFTTVNVTGKVIANLLYAFNDWWQVVHWDILEIQKGTSMYSIIANSLILNTIGNSSAAFNFYGVEGGTPFIQVNSLSVLNSSLTSQATLQPVGTSSLTITIPSGEVDFSYTTIKDCAASGGAIFNAYTSNGCVDGGGNSGINFVPVPPGSRYWVGGTGNFSDTNHWSLSSGGTNGASVPTSTHDAIFDANSFTATGQVVTVDRDSAIYNLDFTGALYNPSIAISNELDIYGSNIILIENMTFVTPQQSISIFGNCSLKSNGNTSLNNIQIAGSGSLSLLDDLTIVALYANNAGGLNLNTNGYTLTTSDLEGNGNDTVVLDGSTINLITMNGNTPWLGFYGKASISAVGTTINIGANGTFELDDSDSTGVNNSISGSSGNKCVINLDPTVDIVSPVSKTTFANITVNGQIMTALLSDGNVDGGGNTNIIFGNTEIILSNVSVISENPTSFIMKVGSVTGVVTSLTRRGFCWVENSSPQPVPTINDNVQYQDGIFGSDPYALACSADENKSYVVRGFVVDNNNTVWYSESVIVSTVVLTNVQVSPVSPSIGVDGTVQFSVIGTYSDNSTLDITDECSYSEIDAYVFIPVFGSPNTFDINPVTTSLIVASVNAVGLVTGLSGGIAKILITFPNGQTNTYLVIVQPSEGTVDIGGLWDGGNSPGYIPPSVISTDLTISSPMLVGSSQRAYIVRYNNDSPQTNGLIPNSEIEWSSSDTSVATIDSNGLISALAVGVTFIKAFYATNDSPAETFENVMMLRVEAQQGNLSPSGIYQYVPLQPLPNQSFRITAALSSSTNKNLNIFLKWNKVALYWEMTISDTSGNCLVDSIPLLAGVAPTINLLRKYSYLNIGSCYIINISNIKETQPDDTNLGTDFVMLWGYTPNE